MMVRLVLIGMMAVVSSLVLIGCATAYQRYGYSGGYTSTSLDRGVYEVSFSGNGYTSPERASDFVLLRAAELALRDGYTYVTIVQKNSAVSQSSYTTPVSSTTSYSYNSYSNTVNAQTYYSGGNTYTYNKPSSTVVAIGSMERSERYISYDAKYLYNAIKAKYGIEKQYYD